MQKTRKVRGGPKGFTFPAGIRGVSGARPRRLPPGEPKEGLDAPDIPLVRRRIRAGDLEDLEAKTKTKPARTVRRGRGGPEPKVQAKAKAKARTVEANTAHKSAPITKEG